MDTGAVARAFAEKTGYKFKKVPTLIQALTHASQATKTRGHNERMEFLGDRVLALVIAEELFTRYEKSREGDMARRLNTLVCRDTCAEVADEIGLGDFMQSVSNGKAREQKLFESRNVRGDAMEAVIAAVYLDGGLEKARKFVLKSWGSRIKSRSTGRKDPKSILQEWVLARTKELPEYELVAQTGPDHSPQFVVQVKVKGHKTYEGEASSKRQAEQTAASKFLKANNIEK